MARPVPVDKGTNNGGANITISSNQSTSTSFFNVGTFTVNAGVTLTIIATDVWQIKANTINILGNIKADGVITDQTLPGPGAGGDFSGSCSTSSAGGGGGSYGGLGTAGSSGTDCNGGSAGPTYGSTTDLVSDPIDTGSRGGDTGLQGHGGGAIYLYASGNITVSGNITALGTNAQSDDGGGGSGGGILLNGNNVTTNIGAIVNVTGGLGGNVFAQGGTGGGGRIKIAYTTLTNNGTISGTGGGSAPTNGTFFTQAFPGPVVVKKKPNQDLMWRFLNGAGDVKEGPFYI